MQSIFGLYVSNLMKSEDYTLLNGRIAYKIGNKKQNITLFVKRGKFDKYEIYH